MSEKYIKAIEKEIKYFKDNYEFDLQTVYIGGGNPSANIIDILTINNLLNSYFDLKRIKEYTIESNPVNINNEYINVIGKMKVNRVSLGVQSFVDESLAASNRNQSLNDVLNALNFLNENIENISIDIINGLPFSDYVKELNALEMVMDKFKNINHISFYELTISEKSKFGKMNLPFLTDEEKEIYENGFCMLMKKKGFFQYEISNFSKKGFESIHNKAYWKYQNYAGIGPGAHSTIDGKRIENDDDVQNYINGDYKKITSLSFKEQMEEYLLMGLRLNEGINPSEFKSRFDKELFSIINIKTDKYKDKLILQDNNFRLTADGFKLMNKVLLDLFDDLDSYIS